MSDIPRAMRRTAKHDTRVEQADLLRWADLLERVEADLRESDRGYQALEQRLHEMEDERERLRDALDTIVRQGPTAAFSPREIASRALSPTTDDQEQSDGPT